MAYPCWLRIWDAPREIVCDDGDAELCRAADDKNLARYAEQPVPQEGSEDYDRRIGGDDDFLGWRA